MPSKSIHVVAKVKISSFFVSEQYSTPPGEGHGNPPQYSCLENSVDREAWQATVHGVAKSWTWLRQLNTHTIFHSISIIAACLWKLSLTSEGRQLAVILFFHF